MKKMFRMRTLFATLAVAAIPATSQAADNMYLKIDTIPGESLAELHPNEIEILAWSWGMDRLSTTMTTSVALSLGKACVSEIVLSKFIDKSSPKLMGALINGTVLPKVKLTIAKSSGGLVAPVDFYTIDMASVFVTSLQEAGSSGEDRPSESFSLKFASATVTYIPLTVTGKPGTAVPVVISKPPC